MIIYLLSLISNKQVITFKEINKIVNITQYYALDPLGYILSLEYFVEMWGTKVEIKLKVWVKDYVLNKWTSPQRYKIKVPEDFI